MLNNRRRVMTIYNLFSQFVYHVAQSLHIEIVHIKDSSYSSLTNLQRNKLTN